MAQIRPTPFPASNSREVKESREEDAYNLLAKNLPDDAIVLYEPTVFGKGGRRSYPDFVLFHPSFGIVTAEVENWNLDKIAAVNTNTVSRRVGDSGMKMEVTHPLKQARQHAFALEESIARDFAGKAVHADGRKKGKIAFPVLRAMIFMGTKETDMDRLVSIFNKTLDQTDVLTEEALSNPQLLLERLQGLTRPFDGIKPGAELLKSIADELIPPAASNSERIRRDQETSEKLLPKAIHELSKPASGEDELATYNRLRADLHNVSRDLRGMIEADASGTVRARAIAKIIEDIETDEFRVGLFGETAAGKSTFINALFGRKLLPQANGETTKIITRIRRPFGEHMPNKATIAYKALADINRETLEYLLIDSGVDIDQKTFSLKNEANMTLLRRLVEEKPSQNANYEVVAAHKFLTAVVKGWKECEPNLGTTVEMDFEASTELCHHEEMAVFIESRDIYIDHEFTKERFMFVDSPGVGSSLARHTRLAEETARDMDAAAMVFNASRPLMEADRRFITRVKEIRDPDSLENWFFILNKISSIDPEQVGASDFKSAVKQECDKVRLKLREDGIVTAPVVPVEAQCALLAQLVTNEQGCEPAIRKQWAEGRYCLEDKKADFPDPGKNLAASGFRELTMQLKNHLSKTKIVGFLGTKYNNLRQVADAFNSDIEKEIAALASSIETLEKEHVEHRESKERAEKKIDEYLNYVFSGKVNKMHYEIKKRANEIAANDIKTLVVDLVRKNAKKYFSEPTGNSQSFWENVFKRNKLEEKIDKIVYTEKWKFQSQYNELRERIRTEVTSDIIIKEYGKDISWRFNYQPLTVGASEPILSIYKLRLGFFQSGKAFIGQFFNNVLRKVRSADEDYFEVENWVTEYMEKNYLADCAEEINAAISGWLESDHEKFKNDTLTSFAELMQAIDEGITARREAIGNKTKERESRGKDLQHYRSEIDSTMEKLDNLKTSIAKLNPR